jgi:hypothetical protein
MSTSLSHIEAIRKANLLHLIDTEAGGNVTEYARMIGQHQSLMNRYASTSGTSSGPMGARAARNFERLVGLPPKRLDSPLPGVIVPLYTPLSIRQVLFDTGMCAELVAEMMREAGARVSALLSCFSLLATDPANVSYRRLVQEELSNNAKAQKQLADPKQPE